MNRLFASVLILFLTALSVAAQEYTVSGTVYDDRDRPMEFVSVVQKDLFISTYTDHDGNFSIRLPKGRSTIGISFMGFRTIDCCLDIDSDMDSLIFTLQPEALNMDEVVVTATAVNSNKGTSVYRVDDQAIKQIQAMNLNDILSLLPGNKMGASDFMSVQQANLRSAVVSDANNFGTSVIVNGMALSNDANMQASNPTIGIGDSRSSVGGGIDLRSISASGIQSVEVITGVGGGQNEYALAGFFGRVNYDYKGRYLFEVSGRYDGSSRFAAGSRWGFFPSGSVGWRISEEPFFKPLSRYVDNLKLRASFGSLGNQNVSSYYTYMRLISVNDFAGYSFGEGSSMAKYSTLSAPVASDLTWETAQQWDFGFDLTMLKNRLNITIDGYVRNTLNMLTDGIELPAVYGASVPDMNTADLQTKGYEIAVSWRDQFELASRPVEYSIGFNVSNYKSYITKYDNQDKTFAKDYYEGMRLGEIWGFVTDGLFQTTEEAQEYVSQVDMSYINNRVTGGWQAGDLKFLDLNDNGKLDIGSNTVDNPGDRRILGNSLPSLSYGINASLRWFGFDASVFFQGTGNHYWYPTGQAMQFWGPYSYPYLSFLQEDFLDEVWSEDNRDAYFTRPMAYSATSGPLSHVNDRYLQNIRYLRLKNLTVGYTLPVALTKKIGVEQARIYFSGENLCYWSPLKKHTRYIDPEAAIDRSDAYNNAYYPWQKTFMFGIDVTF